jgi:hypothetical protein
VTHQQYQYAIKRLGLNQLAAGRFLGVSPRQAQRMASGEARIPKAVGMLLRLMLRYEVKPGELEGF